MSREDIRSMVQEFQKGATTTLLASKYGCSSKHIIKLLRRQGVSTKKSPKIPLSERGRLVALYEDGSSLASLANEFDCSLRTVVKALREADVEIRGQGNTPNPLDPDLVSEVLSLRQDGETQETISDQAGCSVKVVSRILVDHGLSTRPKGPDHHSWKGGKANAEGYVLVRMAPDHPFASTMRRSNGYCLEHRLVLAESLGRALKRHETVHHVNGDKTDNRIKNLQLRKGRHGKHVAYQCADCGSHNVVAAKL